ncbi:unnamed protein product [Periconia digitata]|uniref:Altered inheritance of mitochondria protein 21 n=1 Tax=Periconia digitata TaxID=1303443 RepID=A0A9W4USB4_9PLEO|nr:unnamed protein product [Periconia digitata]
MSAPPTIPPRPSRAQNTQSPLNDVPKIPPRPKRAIERSVSPNRNARSPLNDPSFLHTGQLPRDSQLSPDVPARPPSVSLPSLGQEGIEYASLDDLSKTLSNQPEDSPQQTNVADDLPLHAPKASVPSSTAKSRIQTVTRTDSSQAAAAGFGNLTPDSKVNPSDSGRSLSSAGGNTRPSSIYKDNDEEEHGIPEIGVQVPMYPHAGDVQAPTPGPTDPPPSTGIGFFNKGGQPSQRHHGRTKSGREIFHGPPGSYGLHGHGKIGKDEFEQSWYAKHPEDLKREKAGEYGPHIQENRKDYNWESEKLDKLVHAAKGIGMGTSREAISTPDEQIGYMASEEYASRMASPRPASSGRPSSIHKSLPATESPLRHSKFPEGAFTKPEAAEAEAEEDVIHIDPPAHRSSKIHGGGYDPPTEDLGPAGGNTEEEGGWVTERGYGMPILASDELKKHGPEAEWRQPAIDPELERRTSGEYTVNEDGTPAYITKQRTHSRSSSRNAERQRFVPSPAQFDRSGTPLESTKEYEPLFPEEEHQAKKAKGPLDKLKRPDLARHHFPSQDTWEDTPSSHQLETTVDTPQAEEEPKSAIGGGGVDAGQVFESPENEQARKENITKEDQQSFLPDHTKRFANKHLEKEHLTRPNLQQRFPSQDIWEDSPDQMQLETTVSGPQTPETGEYAEDTPASAAKPSIPPRPSIPARPQKKETSPVDKKAPLIPERPKPQVPVRPSKPLTKSSEKVPTISSEDGGEAAPQVKAKPPVPARPGGSKIAALQAGFMKDLNSKLGLGPPKVKEPEPEEEKEQEPAKPLSDARKGRAKGPQRRKPTASPAPAATVTSQVAVPQQKLAMDIVTTVWSIGTDGELDVPFAQLSAKLHDALKAPSQSQTDAPAASEEVLDKEEHAQPEEANLEPTLVKEATPSDPTASIDAAPEEPDEPIAGQTVGKSEPITAGASDVEPKIENLAPGGGVSLDQKQSLEGEIVKEATEKLAVGGSEEKAKEVSSNS